MTLAALICGLAIGWIARGWLTRLVMRTAVSKETLAAASADIDRNVARWFS